MAKHGYIDERLAEVPMFSACSKQELRQISRLATEVEVKEGRVLTEEGKLGREFMVILDGTATVTIGGEQVATLGPGDSFGEVALLSRGPRTATVEATSDMTLEVVSARDFNQLVEDVPQLARKLLVGLAEYVAANVTDGKR